MGKGTSEDSVAADGAIEGAVDKSTWLSRHTSVATRLAVAVLFVSIVPLISTVIIAQINAGDSTDVLVRTRLDAYADTSANELANYVVEIESGTLILGASQTVIEAVQEFTSVGNELADLSAEDVEDEDASLLEYYASVFTPALEGVRGESVDVAEFSFTEPATVYLQSVWIAQNPFELGDKGLLTDAGDGTTWTTVHRELHPDLRAAADRFGYADLYLVEPENHTVVYSVGKDNTFATSLNSGPYASTALARAVRNASDSLEPALVVEDFTSFAPALDEPVAFLATPLITNGELVGVLAVSITSDGISDILTRAWREGRRDTTGEVYLVGQDRRMRSISRVFVEDPVAYLARVEEIGEVDDIDLNRMAALDTTVLFQSVDTEAVRSGLSGEDGVVEGENYLDEEVVTAYKPVPSEFDWLLVTEIGAVELSQPVADLNRQAIVMTAVFVVLITFLAVSWANWFVSPLRRISAALHRVAEGNTLVSIPQSGAREFRSLAASIDDMVIMLDRRIAASTKAIANKVETLRALLPPAAVNRINEGSRQLVETSQQASVAAVAISGLAEIATELTPDRRREIINMFVDEADALADLNGLERVKMTGDGYYAVCGTETPYLDHTQRTLTFTAQLRDALARYGQENDLPIAMSAGVDSGTVTVGLIGDTRLVYDLWGEAVDNATMLSRVAPAGDIFLSGAANDRTTIGTIRVDAPSLGELDAYRLTISLSEGATK
jgi:class 3 adenylate cyclase